MYKTYRPKGSSVKALQITEDSAEFAATWCHGRVVRKTERQPDGSSTVEHVMFPTLDGVKKAKLSDYLILSKDNGFVTMADVEFNTHYEAARKISDGS
jgi:hypothetical protein